MMVWSHLHHAVRSYTLLSQMMFWKLLSKGSRVDAVEFHDASEDRFNWNGMTYISVKWKSRTNTREQVSARQRRLLFF